MTLRYCLHPGYVRSRNDGDTHYIGITNLIRLYRLPPGSYVEHHRHLGCRGLTPLTPHYDGDYRLPEGTP